MKLEYYIPFEKDQLLNDVVSDFNFDSENKKDLTILFKILEHYFHNDGFVQVQSVKRNYFAFDPDKTNFERQEYFKKCNYGTFIANLKEILIRGNYKELDKKDLEDALNNSDLVGLQLKINFDYFNEYKIFVRGEENVTETFKHNYFWRKEKEIQYFDRVVVLIEYKPEEYFVSNGFDISKLPFSPGTSLLKLFKRVPKNDLETIFPNAIPRMSVKDKLLLWGPALIGGVPLIATKVAPPIITIYNSYNENGALVGDIAKKSLFQGLTALVLIGAYIFKQYKRFENKKIHFAKMLSDSLYFKNLANNSGVFPALIDAAEDEELKETILSYVFLYKSNIPLSAEELDKSIEEWFLQRYNKKLDFDIKDALIKLSNLGLGKEVDGKWSVVPISQALICVDKIWDDYFKFNI
jgi:hypothetical protein